MITKSDDIIVAYTHPAGVDIRYSDEAVIEQSLPLQLKDLAGWTVRMFRRGSFGSETKGVDVLVDSVDGRGSEHVLKVHMIDDVGEAMVEHTYVPVSAISTLVVL